MKTYKEKIRYIRRLYDEHGITESWSACRQIIYEYVSNNSWYTRKATQSESSSFKETTFIYDPELIFKNEHTIPLFRLWVENYYNIYERYKNIIEGRRFLSKQNIENDKKQIMSSKTPMTDCIADCLCEWWTSKIYQPNFEYLEHQFIVRGEEISAPGNTVVRKLNALINCTLTGEKCSYPIESWARDIGIRIGSDRMVVEVFRNFKDEYLKIPEI